MKSQFHLYVIILSLALLLVAFGCGGAGSSSDNGGDDEAGDDEAGDDEAEGDGLDGSDPGDSNDPQDPDDSADDDTPGDVPGNDNPGDDPFLEPGHLKLTLIDAPVDEAEAVFITINQVRVCYLGGPPAADDDVADDDMADDDTADDDFADDDMKGDDDLADDDAADDDAADDDLADDDAADDDDDDDDCEGGEWIDLDIEPTRYNLLELQNNMGALLTDQDLPAGDYCQVRLMFDCTEGTTPTIVIDGEEHDLVIPSGCNTGVKMPHQWTLEAGGEIALVMDFDVRRSVHITGNGRYMMRPVVRLVDAASAGLISGQVLPLDIGAVAYAFENGNYDPQAGDPFENAFNSAIAAADGTFALAALPAGLYDVVIAAEGFESALLEDVEVTGGGEIALDAVELEAAQ